jgi:hypothetical protein
MTETTLVRRANGIIGVTHDEDGSPLRVPSARRGRLTAYKARIGHPPGKGQNYPSKIDRIEICRPIYAEDSKVEVDWEHDTETEEKVLLDDTNLPIFLIGSDRDTCVHTSLGQWTATGPTVLCDGRVAEVFVDKNGKPLPEPRLEPCCRTTGKPCSCQERTVLTFSFALHPMPTVFCRAETSSPQSRDSLLAGLDDLFDRFGSVLPRIPLVLSVRPKGTVYIDPKDGRRKRTRFYLWSIRYDPDVETECWQRWSAKLIETSEKRREVLGVLTQVPELAPPTPEEVPKIDSGETPADAVHTSGHFHTEPVEERTGPQDEIGYDEPDEDDGFDALAQPDTSSWEGHVATCEQCARSTKKGSGSLCETGQRLYDELEQRAAPQLDLEEKK